MSWLARSIANTLRGDEEDDDVIHHESGSGSRSSSGSEDEARGGVKEDLSELTQTLTRQFWGVASFLAPPPATEATPSNSGDPTVPGSPRVEGIRSDLAEIGGRFRSGISMLSNAKAVSEISKIASSLLPFGEEEEEEEAVGVNDDVIAFARSVSMHPETWLDFPLNPDESDEFEMSDAQQEHALAVERSAPSLAELRIELCPSNMSEMHFWKIYFVLLHSRLSAQDSEILSTPQILQARAMLLPDIPRTKSHSEEPDRTISPSPKPEEVTSVPQQVIPISPQPETPSETAPTKAEIHDEPRSSPPSHTPSVTMQTKTETYKEPLTTVPIIELETDKHPVEVTEVKIVDKSMIEENTPVHDKNIESDAHTHIPIEKSEDDGDGDDWLKEETGEPGGTGGSSIPLGNDEDVSFSDLEDD